MKCGAGPLDRSNVSNDQDLIAISSVGNMNEGNTDHTVGTSIAGVQDIIHLIDLDQRSEGGTGPLVGTSNNKEDGLLMNMRGNTNQNMKKTQLSITQFTTRIVCCNGHMGSLVDTMETRDGAGENNGAFADTGSAQIHSHQVEHSR